MVGGRIRGGRMAQEKALRVEPAEWSAGAARLLSMADQDAALDDLRASVESGASRLFVVRQGGAMVLAYVLRVDANVSGGVDGVIVSAGGRADVDLTRAVLPYIETQFSGVDAIRVHTARPGLVKKLRAVGYETAEVVLRKAMQHE